MSEELILYVWIDGRALVGMFDRDDMKSGPEAQLVDLLGDPGSSFLLKDPFLVESGVGQDRQIGYLLVPLPVDELEIMGEHLAGVMPVDRKESLGQLYSNARTVARANRARIALP